MHVYIRIQTVWASKVDCKKNTMLAFKKPIFEEHVGVKNFAVMN